MENETYKINQLSIITPILNGEKNITNLIESINLIEDISIEWIVVDGESTDQSTSIILKKCKKPTKLIKNTNGFYASLNEGIKNSKFEYYIVAGSDDTLGPGLEIYLKNNSFAKFKPDFIAGGFYLPESKKHRKPGKYFRRYRGISGVLSNHSIGLIIKKKLHENDNYYSEKLKYLSDQLFCLGEVEKGVKIIRTDIEFGSVGEFGFTTQNKDEMLKEWNLIKKILRY
jgi:glycosyltransferase